MTQVFEREKKLGSVLTTVNSHLVEEREDDDEHDDHPWGTSEYMPLNGGGGAAQAGRHGQRLKYAQTNK